LLFRRPAFCLICDAQATATVPGLFASGNR
jgi:hypothetical protein